MLRPPRDVRTQRLVDGVLLRYAYLWVGSLETGFCFLSYFTVFAARGVPASALWMSFQTSWSADSADLAVNGRVFGGPEQARILGEAVAAYYLTLVACQAWHVFACKTRIVSLWAHGALRNSSTVTGVILALFISVLFIYVSALQGLFGTAYLAGYWWLTSLPFGAIILCGSEASKAQVRKHPDGCWARRMQW